MNVLHSTTSQDEKRTDKDLALQWNSIHWKDVRVHVNRLQTRIAKAVVRKESFPIAARLPGCEMLEPYDMKVSRTVLRRGGRGNSSPLFGISPSQATAKNQAHGTMHPRMFIPMMPGMRVVCSYFSSASCATMMFLRSAMLVLCS